MMNSKALRSSLMFAVFLCVLGGSRVGWANEGAGAAGETRPYTKAELQAAYDALPSEDKNLVDGWPEEKRREHLERKARITRLQNKGSQKPTDSQIQGEDTTGQVYQLDPLLKQAYAAYIDDSQPRENAVRLFNEYLKKEPNSVFRPEIYYRIGALYSIHRRSDLGEKKDAKLQKEYYEKAHDLYGEKYGTLNSVAWATLANRADASLEFRKGYYDWLKRLRRGVEPNDIYPIRRIGQTLTGQPLKRDAEAINTVMQTIKRNIPQRITQAEKNILWRVGNNYRELVDLAESYPDTELGRQAEARLRKMDKFLLDGLNADSPVLRSVGDNASGNDVKNAADTSSRQAPIRDLSKQQAEVVPENPTSPAATLNKWHLIIIVCAVIGLCAAACGLMAYKRLSGRKNV